MLRVAHIRNKKWSDSHEILQVRSIVFVAMLWNQQKRPPRKYCYQSSEIHCLYRMCQNSPYRLWGLVVETKTIKFSIGTCVMKRTVFPLHAKSPHTLFSAPLTGMFLTMVVHTSFPDHPMSHSSTRLFTCYSVEFVIRPETVELRRTITSCSANV